MIRLHARPLPPLSSANRLSFSIFLCVAGPAYWQQREREGTGVEPNYTTARQIVQSSLLLTIIVAREKIIKAFVYFRETLFLFRNFRVHPEIKKRERKEWMGNSNRVYDEVTRKHFVSAWNSSWVHYIVYMIFSYKKICTSMSRHNYFYILFFFSRWGYFSYLCFLILH